jgi:hypothetical protein
MKTADLTRYLIWSSVVVAGMAMAYIDRRLIGRKILAALLLLAVAGGLLITQFNPFSFGSSSHYMEGVIVSGGAALALTGYLVALLTLMALGIDRSSGRPR